MTLEEGLLLSAIAFVGTHFLLSHPLRTPLVRVVGEWPFRGIYSPVAIITFVLMIYFYREIGRERPLWDSGDAGWIIGSLLIWFASILFVGSFIKNPAVAGVRGPSARPTGVMQITRHPMMWSFAIWAAVHLMIIGTPKAIVLDGAIIILALGGAVGQDLKKARLMGNGWRQWTAQTAFVPFTRGIANPGILPSAGGTVLFFAATWLHPIPAGFWRWIA